MPGKWAKYHQESTEHGRQQPNLNALRQLAASQGPQIGLGGSPVLNPTQSPIVTPGQSSLNRPPNRPLPAIPGGLDALGGTQIGPRQGTDPNRLTALQAALNAAEQNPQGMNSESQTATSSMGAVNGANNSWLQNHEAILDRYLNTLFDKGNIKDPTARARIKEILIDIK